MIIQEQKRKRKETELANSMKFLFGKLNREELKDLSKVIHELILEEDPGIKVPVDIFSQGLNVVESLTKYLKEEEGMTFGEIAKLFNRSRNTVWLNYDRAVNKRKKRFEIADGSLRIPFAELADDRFSLLESIVRYLRDTAKLSNKNTAALLGTTQAVVSMSYSRMRSKQ